MNTARFLVYDDFGRKAIKALNSMFTGTILEYTESRDFRLEEGKPIRGITDAMSIALDGIIRRLDPSLRTTTLADRTLSGSVPTSIPDEDATNLLNPGMISEKPMFVLFSQGLYSDENAFENLTTQLRSRGFELAYPISLSRADLTVVLDPQSEGGFRIDLSDSANPLYSNFLEFVKREHKRQCERRDIDIHADPIHEGWTGIRRNVCGYFNLNPTQFEESTGLPRALLPSPVTGKSPQKGDRYGMLCKESSLQGLVSFTYQIDREGSHRLWMSDYRGVAPERRTDCSILTIVSSS